MQIKQLVRTMHVPIVLHQKKHPWPELGIALGNGRVTWKENDSAHMHLSAKTLHAAVVSPRLDHQDVQQIFQWRAGGGRVWGLGRYAREFSSADPSKPEISGVLGSNPAGMLCLRTVEINYVY